MDSSQRALQTDEIFFLICFRNFDQKPKNVRTKERHGVNIDQNAMYYTSMYLIRQALKTNGKCFFFSNFRIIFRITVTTFFLNNSGVGFIQARWVRHLC